MAHDVFISYSKDDKSTADEVCAALEANGISCWIAPRDIIAGSYSAAIIRAINASKLMVLILSSNANKSPHIRREVERAVSREKLIYPLRIEDVLPSEDLELFISSEQWMDAWPPPIEDHLQRFSDNVRRLLASMSTSTATQQKEAAPISRPVSALVRRARTVITPLQIGIVAGALLLLIGGFLLLRSNRREGSPEAAVTPQTTSTMSPTTPTTSPKGIAFATTTPTPTPTSRPTATPSPVLSREERRSQLIKDVFANDPKTRISGTENLIKEYYSDEKMIPLLIGTANQNFSNDSGIYNTVVVLNGVDVKSLRAHQDLVMQFLYKAESNGDKTKAFAEQVRAKLTPPATAN